MRVIAGTLGGRQFDSPGTHKTHPMSDKMRGAMFNVLGELTGLTVLDAFGGSGALAFEAVSRGATRVTALDNDRTAQQTIAANIKLLDIPQLVTLIKASANAWMQTNASTSFDIVLCDPPYNDLQPQLIRRLAERVNAGGILVLSNPAALEALEIPELTVVKQQNYGDGQLIFYRKEL